MSKQSVLQFWFHDIESKQWFQKSDEFDLICTDKFSKTHKKVISGECSKWRETAQGRLAEVIVIDQFSRNIFRDKPESFLYDPLALILSQECISSGDDKELSNSEKSFLYMPFMHSESLVIHEQAIKLFSQDGLEGYYDFEMKHKKIIEKFGRYPHRNNILGRKSTSEELEYLKEDSGF